MSSALLLLGVAPSGLSPAGPLPSLERHGVLVTVAEVTTDRAMLWVRADSTAPVQVRYGPADGFDVRQVDVAIEPERDHTGRVALERLMPGTRYAYAVRQDDAHVLGTFVTAPLPQTDAPVRVVWSAAHSPTEIGSSCTFRF